MLTNGFISSMVHSIRSDDENRFDFQSSSSIERSWQKMEIRFRNSFIFTEFMLDRIFFFSRNLRRWSKMNAIELLFSINTKRNDFSFQNHSVRLILFIDVRREKNKTDLVRAELLKDFALGVDHPICLRIIKSILKTNIDRIDESWQKELVTINVFCHCH